MRNTRKKIIHLVILRQITILSSLEVEEEKHVFFPRNTHFFLSTSATVRQLKRRRTTTAECAGKSLLLFFRLCCNVVSSTQSIIW